MKVSEGFMLRVLNGEFRGKVFPLRGSIDIGSAGECELCIRDSLVSPSHARLQKEGDEMVVEDLGSSRGTFLNERPVDRANLRRGDLLRVGGTRLSVISDTGQPGGSSPGASGGDRALLKRARAAEAKKVELEKARARLTRQNEELSQKLAQRLDQKKRLVAGLKSVMAARTRLETELEEARDELSRIEPGPPGEVQRSGARGGQLQKQLETVQAELAGQAEKHQQELADSSESLQAVQEELQGLVVKLAEAEAGQAEVNSSLLEEEQKLAESVSAQDELRRRLQALEQDKQRLASSDEDLEKEREVSVGLRGELTGLRRELDSLLAERKQDSRNHRSELASQEEENRQRLEETEQDVSSAYQENIERLQEEKERIAAELKGRETEFEQQAARLAEASAESTRVEESVLRMQEELEQESRASAGFRVRCVELEKEKELLSEGISQGQEKIDSQAAELAESEGRLGKASRELAFFERESKKTEKQLQGEIELLQKRLAAAEKKRQGQEAQLDGLRDSEASRSEELQLLKNYVDDVRQRLLEKEALLQDLGARLLLEGEVGAPLVEGGVSDAS
ncbi:MAG: FHA domain-containing protein [Planctomycetota bacterium]|nr:FHA domain-containing protein [Planctomycetota bacterium]